MKAANSDGVWSAEPAAVRVVITPPFWRTVWFRGTAVLAFGLSLFGGHRLRLRALSRRQRELEAINEDLEQRTPSSNVSPTPYLTT